MDLIGATEVGLKFTTREFDRFNRQLVEQIKPHLEKLWLADALLKFTGDGWLLMIHEAEKVPALCCPAIIMANRFQDEMSQLTKIVIDRIPPLRLAICSGQDTYVVLPDGRKDWVGDSARRATRASGYCFPNEVLIDEPVRYIVFRDFYVKPADVKQRPPKYQPKRMEEDFPVHVLGEPKPEVAADSEAPEYFVYTLSIIGKMKEAEIVAQRVSERLGDEASKLGIAEVAARQGILRSWNRLMASLLDYSSALEMLKSIRDARLVPDVVTYNTLINKAPDYDAAKAWVDTMRGEGIQPSVVTYDTLINKAPDYDAAKAWVDTMRGEGIQPNVITYNTLINKAPDYDAAKTGVDTMRGEGIQPDVVTYNTLIKKAPGYDAAKAWVDTMRGEGIQPDVVTYNTLIKKAPGYDAAKVWVDMMRGEGTQPDVVTYNTLIKKAPDYDAAKAWVETMRGEGIQPGVVAYNILIKKAPDYDAAKAWVETMRGEGIQPSVVTYSTLFSKDLSGKPADEILEWYLAQEYQPEEPIQTAIAAYRKIHRIDQALRLALHYPHLQTARKLMRKHEEEALSYFKTISDHDPEHPNAEYALGIGLMELGRELEAQPHLRKALKLAKEGPRKVVIKEWLRQIDRKLAQKQSVADS
jgi:tetratricopeptide (TPR) repeat protein/class 3 adenylate cyclase